MKTDLKITKYAVANLTGNIWADTGSHKDPDSITTCGAISTLIKRAQQ